jgi:cell division protein FtsB
MNRFQVIRRSLIALLGVCLVVLTARAIVGERGLLDVWRQESALQEAKAEVDAAQARNAALAGEIAQLKTGGAAVERLARERLGYGKPGEIAFLFPEESSDPTPGTPGAH